MPAIHRTTLSGIYRSAREGTLGQSFRWRWNRLQRLGDAGIQMLRGFVVQARGNQVVIDDSRFSLDSPCISTYAKGGFTSASYEAAERKAIAQYLDPALPVVEFGGAVGVVACLTNRKLVDPRRHVVVEANPQLIPLLTANRDANGCGFEILHRMVGYGSPESVFFANSRDFLASTAVEVAPSAIWQDVRLATVGLSEIVSTHGFDKISLICDIEGGEADLLANEAAILRRHVAWLVMEVHPWALGRDGANALLDQLEELGFEWQAGPKRCGEQPAITTVLRNRHLDGHAPAAG